MRFTVEVNKMGDHQVVTLQDQWSGTTAQMYSFGALLNAFTLPTKGGSINCIDGFENIQDAVQNCTAGFKSSKLSPYVCRLHNGKYNYQQKEYALNGFYLGHHAIHGLLFDASFEITNTKSTETGSSVTFCHHYKGTDTGYPFAFTLHVKWRLTAENELQVITTATNNHSSSIPFSDGWHPYFTIGQTIDTTTLRFNSNQQLEFSEDLLPTGNFVVDNRFTTGQTMENIVLDNCFLLGNDQQIKNYCSLKNEAITLTILPDKNYPYLQIYTPPHRKSIAIENLSSAPDSFNNGIGLVVIEPNHTVEFSTTYKLTAN